MTGATLHFFQVDAFTRVPFSGNPAAVMILDEPLRPEAMHEIAAEMNLSETAFTWAPESTGSRRLRWFTPTTEVSLCGHATLATAHVLRELGHQPPFRFNSLAGPLTVDAGIGDALILDFPSDKPEAAIPPPGLLEALGCDGKRETSAGDRVWIVRLKSEAEVRNLRPDFTALRDIELVDGRLGVAVTAVGRAPGQIVSRFFAPWAGIDEDPVTGVAHTALGPFWASWLDRDELEARQLSERGGSLTVRLVGPRVHLIGHAVTVAEGDLLRPQ